MPDIPCLPFRSLFILWILYAATRKVTFKMDSEIDGLCIEGIQKWAQKRVFLSHWLIWLQSQHGHTTLNSSVVLRLLPELISHRHTCLLKFIFHDIIFLTWECLHHGNEQRWQIWNFSRLKEPIYQCTQAVLGKLPAGRWHWISSCHGRSSVLCSWGESHFQSWMHLLCPQTC